MDKLSDADIDRLIKGNGVHDGNSRDEKQPNPTAEAVAPIVGDELLSVMYSFTGRFIAYPSDHAHIAHVLWIAHAHLMDAWESTPRLAFLSPEPSSGKTRALEISELLVPNSVEAINVTPAYLFRKVGDEEKGPPTILYDEIDTVFGPKAKENEEIRHVNIAIKSSDIADLADLADVRDDRGDNARTCAQCNADGEPLYELEGTDAWLHLECRRFWLEAHPEYRANGSDPGPLPVFLDRVNGDRQPARGPVGDSLDDFQ